MQATKHNFMLGVRNNLLSGVGGSGCRIKEEPLFLICAPWITIEE
jgi:hypothetical protein